MLGGNSEKPSKCVVMLYSDGVWWQAKTRGKEGTRHCAGSFEGWKLAVRLTQQVGLVLDLQSHLLELVLVSACVVNAEQQLTTVEGDLHIGLGPTPVTTIRGALSRSSTRVLTDAFTAAFLSFVAVFTLLTRPNTMSGGIVPGIPTLCGSCGVCWGLASVSLLSPEWGYRGPEWPWPGRKFDQAFEVVQVSCFGA